MQGFIGNFSKIAHPLYNLLEKEIKFTIDKAFTKAFGCLKETLISATVIIAPDQLEPFEVMCDASGAVLGVVLGQKSNKIFNPIYYANKAFNGAQNNYTVTKKKIAHIGV